MICQLHFKIGELRNLEIFSRIRWEKVLGNYMLMKRYLMIRATVSFGLGPPKCIIKSEAFVVIEKLTAVSAKLSCSLAQLAIAWQLHQPAITAPIIGPRTMAQLVDGLAAVEIELDENILQQIDEISLPGQFTVPYYGGGLGIWTGWEAPQYAW